MLTITLLLQVLPLALGAALSPTLLALQLVILTGGKGATVRAWALALGRMTSLAIITVGGASLLARLPDVNTGSLRHSPYAAAILAVGGLVLLAVAFREHRHPRDSHHTSRLTSRVIDAPAPALFAFGAGWMFVNASTLALYIPALHAITRSQAAEIGKLGVVTILFLLTSAAALLPPLAVTVFGDSVRPRLDAMQRWITAHGHSMSVAVTAGFGALLVVLAVVQMLRN